LKTANALQLILKKLPFAPFVAAAAMLLLLFVAASWSSPDRGHATPFAAMISGSGEACDDAQSAELDVSRQRGRTQAVIRLSGKNQTTPSLQIRPISMPDFFCRFSFCFSAVSITARPGIAVAAAGFCVISSRVIPVRAGPDRTV